jgi:hypothetical protein
MQANHRKETCSAESEFNTTLDVSHAPTTPTHSTKEHTTTEEYTFSTTPEILHEGAVQSSPVSPATSAVMDSGHSQLPRLNGHSTVSNTPTTPTLTHQSSNTCPAAVNEDCIAPTPSDTTSTALGLEVLGLPPLPLAVTSLALHTGLSAEELRVAQGSGTNASNAEGKPLVSMHDLWAQLRKTVPKTQLPARGASPPRPPSRNGNTTTAHPDGNRGAVSRSPPKHGVLHSGRNTMTMITSDAAYPSNATRVTVSQATSAPRTANRATPLRDCKAHSDLGIGTLSVTGSGGTLSEAYGTQESYAADESQIQSQKESHKTKPSQKGANHSRYPGIPHRSSSHGIDNIGLPPMGPRSDRAGSAQSRNGRETLPEIQDPQAVEADDSAALKDAVDALVAQGKRQRSSGGHEISIGSLQLILVEAPIVKGVLFLLTESRPF